MKHFQAWCCFATLASVAATVGAQESEPSPLQLKMVMFAEQRDFSREGRQPWHAQGVYASGNLNHRWIGVGVQQTRRFGLEETETTVDGGLRLGTGHNLSLTVTRSSGQLWRPAWSVDLAVDRMPMVVRWGNVQWRVHANVQRIAPGKQAQKQGVGATWMPSPHWGFDIGVDRLQGADHSRGWSRARGLRLDAGHGLEARIDWVDSVEFDQERTIPVDTVSLSVGYALGEALNAKLFVAKEKRPDIGPSRTVGAALSLSH